MRWGQRDFVAWALFLAACSENRGTNSIRDVDLNDASSDTGGNVDALDLIDLGDVSSDAGGDVDALDPIWDEPVEWEASVSGASPTEGGTCGIRLDGSYEGPCHLQLADDWVSTLCDESRSRCVAPTKDCRGGWCFIPPRSFLAAEAYDYRPREWPRNIPRTAVVPRGFFVTQTEVTMAQFGRLMGYFPATDLRCGPDCPAAGVSAFEAMEFANRLSDLHKLERCHILEGCAFVDVSSLGGSTEPVMTWACEAARFVGPECKGYRLPSRRESELAIRAGSPFCLSRGPFEDEIGATCEPRDPKSFSQQHVVFCGNSQAVDAACPTECPMLADGPAYSCWPAPPGGGNVCLSPRPVRSRFPNDFGLYDAYGNVREWTLSREDNTPYQSPDTIETSDEFVFLVDGALSSAVPPRLAVTSGGYEFELAGQCGGLAADVYTQEPNVVRNQYVGFRIVRTASLPRP